MSLGLHRLFRRRLTAWWTLVVGLVVTAVVGWELHREAVALDRHRLALRVAEIQSQLDTRLEKSEMLLNNLRDYLTWSGESRNSVFYNWCYENGLTINCPWILGIAVATNRNLGPLPENLFKAANHWTNEDLLELQRQATNRPISCDIALKSTLTNGNQFLADYGLAFEFLEDFELGKRRSTDTLATVIRNSSIGMSLRRTVMLDPGGNAVTGTWFCAPIYRPELSDIVALQGTMNSRRDARVTYARWLLLSALVVAPVDFKVLVESVWQGHPADLGVEIFSSTNVLTADTWMNATEGGPRAADPHFKAYMTHHQTWPMYRQRFTLFFYTTPLFEAQSPRRLAYIATGAGTLLTLLATALVGVALRARNRQELMTEQIREARDALAAAQRERNQISRDLHDGTIQSLYAIQLGLGRTAGKLAAEPVKAGSELSAVRGELDAVIAEIRQFITAETATDQPVDFCAVLLALVKRTRAGTAVQIDLQCDSGASGRLTGDQAVQLANIAREALSNSLRHAKARAVRLALHPDGERVVLEIADDGAGFEPASPRRTGVGLASMQSRAHEMQGTFEMQSSPGEGTRIVVRVPARSPEPGEAGCPAALCQNDSNQPPTDAKQHP